MVGCKIKLLMWLVIWVCISLGRAEGVDLWARDAATDDVHGNGHPGHCPREDRSKTHEHNSHAAAKD